MNISNYVDCMILRVIAGSHAYDMATEHSDLDVKGILIPPYEYLLGIYTFEQTEGDMKDDPLEQIGLDPTLLRNGGEFTYYSLQKYFKLARDCNPSILELLFSDPKHYIWDGITPENRRLGELLIRNRRLFLSQKVRFTYTGYAHAQLKRIKGHNKWLTNPQPEEKPRPVNFMKFYPLNIHEQPALFYTAHIALEDDPDFEKWILKYGLQSMGAKPIPGTDNKAFFLYQKGRGIVDSSGALLSDYSYNYDPDSPVIGILVFQRDEYRSQLKKWKEYWDWVRNRNPARSELEKKYGYDTKHAAHLIRLLRTGYELMSTGELHVLRPDAEELLAIRNGAWSYKQLIDHAEETEQKIIELYDSPYCPLPMKPDIKKINQLYLEMIEPIISRRLSNEGSY